MKTGVLKVYFTKKMKEKRLLQRGVAQVPLIIGLLILSIALPAATSLVKKVQETRRRAVGSGYLCYVYHFKTKEECERNLEEGKHDKAFKITTFENFLDVSSSTCSPESVPPTSNTTWNYQKCVRVQSPTPTPAYVCYGFLYKYDNNGKAKCSRCAQEGKCDEAYTIKQWNKNRDTTVNYCYRFRDYGAEADYYVAEKCYPAGKEPPIPTKAAPTPTSIPTSTPVPTPQVGDEDREAIFKMSCTSIGGIPRIEEDCRDDEFESYSFDYEKEGRQLTFRCCRKSGSPTPEEKSCFCSTRDCAGDCRWEIDANHPFVCDVSYCEGQPVPTQEVLPSPTPTPVSQNPYESKDAFKSFCEDQLGGKFTILSCFLLGKKDIMDATKFGGITYHCCGEEQPSPTLSPSPIPSQVPTSVPSNPTPTSEPNQWCSYGKNIESCDSWVEVDVPSTAKIGGDPVTIRVFQHPGWGKEACFYDYIGKDEDAITHHLKARGISGKAAGYVVAWDYVGNFGGGAAKKAEYRIVDPSGKVILHKKVDQKYIKEYSYKTKWWDKPVGHYWHTGTIREVQITWDTSDLPEGTYEFYDVWYGGHSDNCPSAACCDKPHGGIGCSGENGYTCDLWMPKILSGRTANHEITLSKYNGPLDDPTCEILMDKTTLHPGEKVELKVRFKTPAQYEGEEIRESYSWGALSPEEAGKKDLCNKDGVLCWQFMTVNDEGERIWNLGGFDQVTEADGADCWDKEGKEHKHECEVTLRFTADNQPAKGRIWVKVMNQDGSGECSVPVTIVGTPAECPAREKYDCSSSLIAVSRVASCLLQHCFEGGGENCVANCDYNCDGEGNSGDLEACLSDRSNH